MKKKPSDSPWSGWCRFSYGILWTVMILIAVVMILYIASSIWWR